MSRSIATGPLLLLLWQAAPVNVVPDSSGRVRVSLAFGAGAYQSKVEQMSCETGEVTKVSTKEGGWTTGTAEVEAWPTNTIRANVVTTQIRAGRGAPDRFTTAGLVAAEWRHVGVGAGFVHGSGADPFTTPLVYFRLADLDKRHFRVEIAVPEPPVPARTWLRIGTGKNLGRRGGARWMTGVAMTLPGAQWLTGVPTSLSGDGDSHVAFFGDAFVPVGRGANPVELKLSAQLGLGDIYHESIGVNGEYTSWRFGAGLRYSFGR
jgi:hypothetical protein